MDRTPTELVNLIRMKDSQVQALETERLRCQNELAKAREALKQINETHLKVTTELIELMVEAQTKGVKLPPKEKG